MFIIGLGNPGEKYKNNRHNVGHQFIDYLTQQTSNSKSQKLNIKIFKTDVFMNESGDFVKKLIGNRKFKIENLVIVHDDLDIPFGKFRIDFARGPRLHNGIKSIEQTLKNKNFWRIRIGVDNRKKTGWVEGEKYVLQDFLADEKKMIESEVFPKVLKKLEKKVEILNI
ncbi:MAG: aminoacyl-tRNA hydrolase [Microgenomates group bacterium]